MALPPDFTRFNSRAGLLTCQTHDYFGERLVDVMPALGTHFPMPAWQLDRMFPSLPKDQIREHRWRSDVITIGEDVTIIRAKPRILISVHPPFMTAFGRRPEEIFSFLPPSEFDCLMLYPGRPIERYTDAFRMETFCELLFLPR